jgi:basic membrane lipoprotein Med (substrate-binding protein (PBP1-ABC) superfamily)
VAVVLDEAGDDDNAFNEFTLKGARQASEELGLDFSYVVSSDYESDILKFAGEGYDLIITVGFLMTDATENSAKANPDTHFAIVDVDYPSYDDLPNVTSLTFAEEEAGYLAGVLAGCMTETDVIASVSGMELPPVVRFVTGFQEGAESVNPDVTTLNRYVPDFNDPETGFATGNDFIEEGADVIFGVGGNTGNAGLQAACEAGIMGIGIDVDQYYTLGEISGCLMSSAMKNVDVAAGQAVKDFASGNLTSGIRKATVANGGIAMAPYHDWEDRIPDDCKTQVQDAIQELVSVD